MKYENYILPYNKIYYRMDLQEICNEVEVWLHKE